MRGNNGIAPAILKLITSWRFDKELATGRLTPFLAALWRAQDTAAGSTSVRTTSRAPALQLRPYPPAPQPVHLDFLDAFHGTAAGAVFASHRHWRTGASWTRGLPATSMTVAALRRRNQTPLQELFCRLLLFFFDHTPEDTRFCNRPIRFHATLPVPAVFGVKYRNLV
jgi:hypothetical protein